MLGNHSFVEYLTLSNKIYEAEAKRLNTYLQWPDLFGKIINEFQQELLIKNQKELIESSTPESLDGNLITLYGQKNSEALELLYKLYSPMKDIGLKPIANEFKFYLIQQGKRLISESDASLQGKEQSIKIVFK